MTEPAFNPGALAAFATAYPAMAVLMPHRLVEHPLLAPDALAELAHRLPATIAVTGAAAPDTAGRPDTAIALAHVERDPAMRDLLFPLLAELAPAVAAATGEMLSREAAILLSPAGASTAPQREPGHSLQLQLRGTRVLHLHGHGEETVAVGPGQAVHVPAGSVCRAVTGPTPSVALVLGWQSRWSIAHGRAHGMNDWLQRIGLTPAAPRGWPHRNRAKAIGYRLIRRVHATYNALRGTEI